MMTFSVPPGHVRTKPVVRPKLAPPQWGGPKDFYTLENYRVLLSSEFSRSIFNSLFICAASVIVSTAAAVTGPPSSPAPASPR